MKKILVIGESCTDIFVYGKTPRLCPEAPVPVFNPVNTIKNGGMAKNVHKNLLSLGVEANLFTNQNYSSITKTRYIDLNMNHMFIRVDKNDDKYGNCDITSIKYNDYDAIIVSDYNKGFLTEKDIETISQNHDIVFLDTKKTLGPWCKNIKYIKINNTEYEKTRHTICKSIKQKLIVTMGGDGCKYLDIIYPVPEVEIKDSSGAGDTFIASLTSHYIKSNNIEESIRFANKCATAVVQKRGTSTV